MLGLGSKKRDQAIQDEKAFTPGEPVRYGGFNGNNLLVAIVFTATVGFSLFGYDQGKLSRVLQILLVFNQLTYRSHVWYHWCRDLQQ